MKEAFGGIFTIQAITIALLIIMALLAFTVNYTKAYRVKNEVLNIIQKYEGMPTDPINDITEEIDTVLVQNKYFLPDRYIAACRRMGYDVYESTNGQNGVRFCLKCEKANAVGEVNAGDRRQGYVYSVVTFVTFDLPIVNNIIPVSSTFFTAAGETPIIYSNVDKGQWCD